MQDGFECATSDPLCIISFYGWDGKCQSALMMMMMMISYMPYSVLLPSAKIANWPTELERDNDDGGGDGSGLDSLGSGPPRRRIGLVGYGNGQLPGAFAKNMPFHPITGM